MGESTRYEDNLQEKQAQHEALAEALKDYGHSVLHGLLVTYWSIRVAIPHCIIPTKVGAEHGPASKVLSKLHQYSVVTFCKTVLV